MHAACLQDPQHINDPLSQLEVSHARLFAARHPLTHGEGAHAPNCVTRAWRRCSCCLLCPSCMVKMP
eukprot:1160024-Pelagomonas_calceolata.AAC.5